MKVVIIGDLHTSGKNPICRKDDLVETQFEKLEEIVEFANEHDSPVLSVGDLFHTSVVSNTLVNEFGGLINSLKHPLYFVWGNHDLLYHSLALWKSTSLGILLQNNPKIKHISSFKKDYGIPWDYLDWDSPIKKKDSKFLLSHKAVVSRFQAKANFWLRNDETFSMTIPNKCLDEYTLIVCGHWHKPYDFVSNRTQVINPGPVNRNAVENNLQPAIVLLDLENLKFTRHNLESAKPYDEVISSKHIKTSGGKNTQEIREFIHALKIKMGKKKSSFIDTLSKFLKSNELSLYEKRILQQILSKHMEGKIKE